MTSTVPDTANESVTALAYDLQDPDTRPPEVNVLGRTLARWHAQIVAWHQACVSNGPTGAPRSRTTIAQLSKPDPI